MRSYPGRLLCRKKYPQKNTDLLNKYISLPLSKPIKMNLSSNLALSKGKSEAKVDWTRGKVGLFLIADGFKAKTVKGVKIKEADITRVDVTLEPAGGV